MYPSDSSGQPCPTRSDPRARPGPQGTCLPRPGRPPRRASAARPATLAATSGSVGRRRRGPASVRRGGPGASETIGQPIRRPLLPGPSGSRRGLRSWARRPGSAGRHRSVDRTWRPAEPARTASDEEPALLCADMPGRGGSVAAAPRDRGCPVRLARCGSGGGQAGAGQPARRLEAPVMFTRQRTIGALQPYCRAASS